MKTLFKLSLYFLLLSTMIFSQNRTSETNNRNFKELKSRLIKSERSIRKDRFREKQFSVNNIDEQTIINKKLLENGFLQSEEIYQTWNGSSWMDSIKYSYTYDENNNRTEELQRYWDGSSWMDSIKYLYTYDENNNLIKRFRQTWLGSYWLSISKDSYAYDENNNRTEYLYQSWDGSGWVNYEKILYTYDENNNRIELLGHDWYNGWERSDWIVLFSYDENNNLTEKLWQFLLSFNDSGWVNIGKSSYTYDESNNLTKELWQPCYDSAWGNPWKYSYTYDENNNRTEELDQEWKDSAWVNNSKYSYTYDENNNRTEWVWQLWNDSTWVNGWNTYDHDAKVLYTYDENNNRTEELGQEWKDSAWVNDYKYSYKYGSVTKINEDLSLINSYSLSNNYPNPFNPSTTIRYTIPKQSHITLKIYDILGREVATLVDGEKPTGNYKVTFNAINLASGVYFYQLKSGSFVQSKKMVLMK